MSIVTQILEAFIGSKNKRDLKQLYPYIEKINTEWQKLANEEVSDNQLRQETQKLQQYIADSLINIDDQINKLKEEVQKTEDVYAHETFFDQIDQLEKERNKKLEEILLEILPKTFAIVKETARRWKENKQLVVEATFWDKQLAATQKNITIEGEKAIWHNKWEAAGNEIEWNMVHYDVQLIGGVVLHQGKIAEMATGEGKTLVATLPAFLNALAKRGVHIVTVNDYLARRDSQWMGPLYQFHGLTVDCIDFHTPHSPERQKAYQADITYGTNNEFGFDYLRDNMARDANEMVQHKHHFAMVDEVDSVLIDDARTPLIISGPTPNGHEHEFYELRPRVVKLVEAQKKLVQDFLNEAKNLIKNNQEKEAGLPLFRAFRGLPKNKPLIKFLGETGIKTLLQKTENIYLADNSKMMPEADKVLYFTIDEKNNQIDLTEKGIDFITGAGEDPKFFILPDIATEITNIEKDNAHSELEKAERKDTLIQEYSVKAQRIHSINQLLKAYTLFEKEKEYVIMDGKVKIVDEQTGRIMEGRRYSDGLHQALEAKENVKVEEASQTYATITLQNYFRMYHKLSGMTGTAETEAGEFWEIYKLDVVVIPTNVTCLRKDNNDLVFKTTREKFNAVAQEIETLIEGGRPVLVGTTSVEISELLSRMLSLRKIKHQVLNAKLHQKEAEIVAEAGKPGTVTIATNMAGRGTDIKLTEESRLAGGLAIIGTERHESRRVDRQLRGRSGRQGDPGSSQFFVSLEDDLMRLFGSDRIARVMDRIGYDEGEVIQHSMITASIERAQKKVEENNFGARKRLLEYDDVMNSQREIIYKRRKNALHGDRLAMDINNIMYDTCEALINNYQGIGNFENFRLHLISHYALDPNFKQDEFEKGNPTVLTRTLFAQMQKEYQEKNQEIIQKVFPLLQVLEKQQSGHIEEIGLQLTDNRRSIHLSVALAKALSSEGKEIIKEMEKMICLAIIDQNWKEHLREMDDLKQSVQMATHEQKDPLLIYKFEAFELFKQFITKVNEDTISFLIKANLPASEAPQQIQESRRTRRTQAPKLKEKKDEAQNLVGGGQSDLAKVLGNNESKVIEKQAPVKLQKAVGRNDKVTVQYNDGRVLKDVKYKSVEQDIKNSKCVIID
ncbi:MAG: preprotein translocase subunit SecA [Cytophagales bacterium]|nr:MAG: preprotein translocase subunit SecA [Cytophagales bacterium]